MCDIYFQLLSQLKAAECLFSFKSATNSKASVGRRPWVPNSASAARNSGHFRIFFKDLGFQMVRMPWLDHGLHGSPPCYTSCHSSITSPIRPCMDLSFHSVVQLWASCCSSVV